MPQATLKWRLHEWLLKGCQQVEPKLSQFSNHPNLKTLIIAGEEDLTLPSTDEADRLAQTYFTNDGCCHIHIVPGAGHASTCGSRLDLMTVMRNRFSELDNGTDDSTAMNHHSGAMLGMEPRYDNATIGLNPLLYWSSPDNYLKAKHYY